MKTTLKAIKEIAIIALVFTIALVIVNLLFELDELPLREIKFKDLFSCSNQNKMAIVYILWVVSIIIHVDLKYFKKEI